MPDPVQTPPQGGTPPASGTDQPWHANFENKDVSAWVASFGDSYKTPESIAVKAYNLEKLLGADKAGRAVVPPKADAKPEEWSAFYRKHMGAPEKPEGYVLSDTFKDSKVHQEFRNFAHGIGMPASMFQQQLAWIDAQQKANVTAHEARIEAQADKEMLELQTEWGVEYDRKAELGRRAARAFIPHEDDEGLEDTLAAIEIAIGTKATMNLFAAIGAGLGEHAFVTGSGPARQGGMTPEAARLRIKELRADQAWVKKYSAGDADAKIEWDKLHRVGYGQPV